MIRPVEILGEVVDRIRELRHQGSKGSEIVRFLGDMGVPVEDIARYLKLAFYLGIGSPNLFLLRRDEAGIPVATDVDRYFEPALDAKQSLWKSAPPFPDLMRRVDRREFREVASETGTIIVVRAGNRSSGKYIGVKGFGPAPADLYGVCCNAGVHQGLLAADPDDPLLLAFLEALRPCLGYASYRDELERSGFSIGSRDEGYLIRNGSGTAFFPPYLVLGVYDDESRSSAWSAASGEKVRAALNRKLGLELVKFAPLDFSYDRARLGKGNFLFGPQVPAVAFLPNGSTSTLLDREELSDFYKVNDLDWEGLY